MAAIVRAQPDRVVDASRPVLIDEWQRVPELWDRVRRAVDAGAEVKYHAQVFANQPQEGAGFTNDDIIGFAQTSGITGDALVTFTDCLKSEKYAGWVANSHAAFDSEGFSSTPTGVLDGTQLTGEVLFDPAQLTAAIEAATKS